MKTIKHISCFTIAGISVIVAIVIIMGITAYVKNDLDQLLNKADHKKMSVDSKTNNDLHKLNQSMKKSKDKQHVYFFLDLTCADCQDFYLKNKDIIKNTNKANVSRSYAQSPVLGKEAQKFADLQMSIDESRKFKDSEQFVDDVMNDKMTKDIKHYKQSRDLKDTLKLRKSLDINSTPTIIYESKGKYYFIKDNQAFMNNLKNAEK